MQRRAPLPLPTSPCWRGAMQRCAPLPSTTPCTQGRPQVRAAALCTCSLYRCVTASFSSARLSASLDWCSTALCGL